MITVRAIYLKVLFAALSLAVVLWGFGVLSHDWNSGHTSLYVKSQKINWFSYYADYVVSKIAHFFRDEQLLGLPPVHLFVSARAQEALMERLPDSTKIWQRGHMLYADSTIRPVKVRFRGDNPFNWMFDKKSWRVKTKKSDLVDGTRTFNYVVPQVLGQSSEYLSMWIARRLGVLAPDSRLVELFVNGRGNGVYLEFEHLDEVFLRKHGLMPVNLYKGEQMYQEQAFMVDFDLFNNPALWRKLSINNQFDDDDFADLASVLSLIRRAETSETAFNELKMVAPYAEWARYAAFSALLNNGHNSFSRNMRVAFDGWKGNLIPIAHDIGISNSLTEVHQLDKAPHSLLRLYNRHSDFLLEKYRKLYGYVFEDNIFGQAIEELASLEAGLAITTRRDENLFHGVYGGGDPRESATPEGVRRNREILARRLGILEENIRGWLTGPPEAKWQTVGAGIALNIGGTVPVGNVTLVLVPNARRPQEVAVDTNLNGFLDDADMRLPFEESDEGIRIVATWLSNRSMESYFRRTARAVIMEFVPMPARFDIIGDVTLAVSAVRADNALTGEVSDIPHGVADGVTAGRWNRPVVQLERTPAQVWQGLIPVSGETVITYPVRILPGTTLVMAAGSSLVFRGHLSVEGSETHPVIVKPATAGEPWGVFALQGEGTKGSQLRHMSLSGGSGAAIDLITYTGMLSIHDTSDVLLQSVEAYDNYLVDDMVHVVYGTDIQMLDSNFRNARGDAVDIDISSVRIDGGQISAAGNDAIDLMTSTAQITSLDLDRSGDKGISVGEGSQATVWNVRLLYNAIGIESKDASEVFVVNSDFVGNSTQINSYEKNWRYGSGGTVEVWRSYLAGPQNRIVAEAESSIFIADSTLTPLVDPGERILFSADVGSAGRRAATGDGEYAELQSHLAGIDQRGLEDRRGALR